MQTLKGIDAVLDCDGSAQGEVVVKKVVLTGVGVLLAGVAGVLAFAASKPDTLHIERSVSIKAPPEKIFALLNDLHSWQQWSPWDEKDPNQKRSFSGPQCGKGATFAWDGNENVGAGNMEIVEVTEPTDLKINLHFIKPMPGDDVTHITLAPEGQTTKVTWSMEVPADFPSKLFQVFVNLDDMCGKDFEKGLANLKAKTEAVATAGANQ